MECSKFTRQLFSDFTAKNEDYQRISKLLFLAQYATIQPRFVHLDPALVLLYSDIRAEIDLNTDTVVINGDAQKVRPKTFQLLKVLIEANGDLVSKEQLLATVWDDVIVDEQVIFQSVKELRKLFAGHTVIKTVPRKGYAWLPKPDPLPSESSPVDSSSSKRKHFLLAASFVALVFVVFVAFWGWESEPDFASKPNTQDKPVSGSVVVLPVQTNIATSDYDWVRYGIMDQVISRLESTAQAGVLQTDYVLDVIARAQLSKQDLASGNVDGIFDVSGAELVLAMQLTGSPNDYQLLYTLYERDNLQKGVVLDGSVQDAADQVAQLVGNRLSPDFQISAQTDANHYESSFAHRLIAEALERKTAGDPKGARELLEAALVATPDNLAASRLLVQTLVESGEPHALVNTIAVPALKLANQQSSTVDAIRLSFWLALSESLHGDRARGQQLFTEAQTLAESINDWLYLAYIEEIRGSMNLSAQNFASANSHFNQAMEYHRILHCPLGQSNTYMHLSRLAYAQQNSTLAMKQAQQALELIESRKLASKLPAAKQWMKQLVSEPSFESKPGSIPDPSKNTSQDTN